MGKKWKSKKPEIGNTSILNRAMRRSDINSFVKGKKTELFVMRVSPPVMEWMREQGNMSKYIMELIKKDMLDHWPE